MFNVISIYFFLKTKTKNLVSSIMQLKLRIDELNTSTKIALLMFDQFTLIIYHECDPGYHKFNRIHTSLFYSITVNAAVLLEIGFNRSCKLVLPSYSLFRCVNLNVAT